jgi:hypothetical protein
VIVGVLVAATVVLLVLAVAAVAMFASGFIPLTGLQHHVTADLQARLGPGWTVQAHKAAIVRQDGRPVLQIRDTEFLHQSGVRIRAPEADVGIEPLAYLRGAPVIRSIDLHGVVLTLRLDENGALLLDTGGSELTWSPPPAAPNERGEAALAALNALAAAEEALGGLDHIALTQARVRLAGPDGNERVALDRVAIHLDRKPEGRRLSFVSVGRSGENALVLDSRRDEGGAPRYDLTLRSLQLADFSRLLGDSVGFTAEGFRLSGQFGISMQENSPVVVGRLALGRGRLVVDGGNPPVVVDGAEVDFTSSGELRSVVIGRGEVTSGVTILRGSGVVELREQGGWQAELRGAGVLAGEGRDPPQPLTAAHIVASGRGKDAVALDSFHLQGPQLDASGSVRFRAVGDGRELTATLTASNSRARALMAAWPVAVSPIIRNLISERVEAGDIDALQLDLAFPPPVFAASLAGTVIPDDSVRVSVSARNARFMIANELPRLDGLAVEGTATGRTLALRAPQGRMEVSRGRVLQLTEGTFDIADTYDPRPIGRSTFRATGGVDALAELLAHPLIRESSPGQIDPASVRGRIDLRTSLSLPLVENLRPSEVVVTANGSMTQLAADRLAGREPLEGGTLTASFDRGTLSLSGDARIGGTPAQITVRQNPRGQGEATVSMTIDQAARQRRGFGFDGALTGPVSLRAVKPLGRAQDTPLRMEVDLTRAGIDGLLPGWVKTAGRPGRLTFQLSEDEDGAELSDIVLDSTPVMLRGRAEFRPDGTLEAASFTQARLSPGDDMRVELKRDGTVMRTTIRGQVADARPFLKVLTSPAPPRKGERAQDIDIDLQLPILTGYNNEAVGNAVLKLSRRGREIRQLEFSGRIGRAPLSITQGARNGGVAQVQVRAEDGGALLRYVDLYRRAFGGDLIVDMQLQEERITGDILFRDFRVRGEPALRRVLSEQFAQAQGGERAAGGGSREAGNDVAFTKLKSGFVRTPTRFEIRDGVIWGNEIGVTAQGSIDYGRDRVDIAGTFIPGYALNNAFSQVPVLGRILGGGQYEGLFAVNFRVSGAASAPSMSINPLSAIAPGIFRRFVDPLGGVPNSDMSQPPAAQR